MTEQSDWGQFGFTYDNPTPEEEKAEENQKKRKAEYAALNLYKDDYRWIKACDAMEIEALQKIVDAGPWSIGQSSTRNDPPANEKDREWCLKRYRQAQVVLAERKPEYNPLADTISRMEGKL